MSPRRARAALGLGLAGKATWAVLATERARSTDALFAITVPANRRGWRLMERLGIKRAEDGDFDHPDLAPDSPLRRHVLYRIARPLNG